MWERKQVQLPMLQRMLSPREVTIFTVASLLTIGLAAAYTLAQIPPGPLRSVDIILLLTMALIHFFMPKEHAPGWQFHAYLAVQASIVAALLFLQPSWSMFTILYCPLSVQAVLRFSRGKGWLWVALFGLVTAASFAFGISLGDGLTALVMYGGIYAFFGAYAAALNRANIARRESQSVLAELQEVHELLQEYALHTEEMAVVEERNRLAREMHDTLGYRLTVTAVQLEGAQRLIAKDPERASRMIETVRGQVREGLSELRQTVAALRQPLETELTLHHALNRLMSEFEKATSIQVNRILPEKIPPMPDRHRLALYRAAQEALTNIQRHANAGQAWLTLMAGEEQITLLVSDDGIGFPDEHTREDGFGLPGLHERAAHLGGELMLEARPGGGTQLHFSLPLPPECLEASADGESLPNSLEAESLE